MSDPTAPEIPEDYGRHLTRLAAETLTALEAMEAAQRRLHPPLIAWLRGKLAIGVERLSEGLELFRESEVPEEIAPFHREFLEGADLVLASLRLFVEPAAPEDRVRSVLASMRSHSRAQEALYPLRQALPSLGRYFAEPAWHDRLAELDPEPPDGITVGLHRASPSDDLDARGGFSLYVPERYDGSRPRPLVVALHGGSGTGRDFLWTWLREARSRDFLLLAPTSLGGTWALEGPDRDGPNLVSMVAFIRERWNIDVERILLTGMSDGATYALLGGLAEDSPFTALAPVSGVLHPVNFANGNMDRARGRRIYLVHGALDWMFPAEIARMSRDELEKAGAELTFREIEDLSHTYPREENDRILRWLDPTLIAAGPQEG